MKEWEQIKPQKLVFDAKWAARGYYDAHRKLNITITKLRAAGIDDIVVIGPLPIWKSNLPTILATKYIHSGKLLNRMKPPDYKRLLNVDREMAELCKQWNVSYISPVQLLCNKDGCLTMTSDDPASVMTFDSNHLTGNASDYLVSRFKDDPAFKVKSH